jgi:pyruvate,water dikinase
MDVRWFAEVGLADRAQVGGKAAGLGELVRAGMAVPDGFAVPVGAFEAFRDTGALRADLRALVRGVDAASPAALLAAHRTAVAAVRATPLPAQVEGRIRAAYAELCRRHGRADDLPVAVRSSAVAEDGEAASFAGQQETYLGVVGADRVVARVRDCWAGLYTPQAIAYRHALAPQRAAEATRIAVAVQALVDAAVAGVAFTVSPRTGDRSVVAINAAWGLGHGVVSGEVTPDEYRVSKIGPEVTARVVAHKPTRCVADPDAEHGVAAVEVDPADRDRACLDDPQILELARLAVRVEQHHGTPQDIEWALTRDGRFVLLQSRPETTWRARAAARAAARRPGGGYLDLVQAVAGARGAERVRQR